MYFTHARILLASRGYSLTPGFFHHHSSCAGPSSYSSSPALAQPQIPLASPVPKSRGAARHRALRVRILRVRTRGRDVRLRDDGAGADERHRHACTPARGPGPGDVGGGAYRPRALSDSVHWL